MTSRGFLIYAHNNEEIDYGKLAICCSLMIKANLKENAVCLVTDQGTLDWLEKSVDAKLLEYAFDHIRVVDYAAYTKNSSTKKFLDTNSTIKNLTWYNGGRCSAYELSPFDETVIIDSDVLVQDRSLDLVWGNYEDIMINCDALTLEHKTPDLHSVRLDGMGIPMYWATLVYFKKCERAKLLFDLVQHIKEKYEYYQFVYEFPGKLYRNDYAFSIAIHMMNGFLENNEIKSFPVSTIVTSFDVDELLDVRKNELIFLVNVRDENWRFLVSNMRGVSVHAMNKYAILRNSSKIIDIYYTNHQ